MDESKNTDDIGENNDLLFNGHHRNFLESTHKQYELVSQNSLATLMKHSLLIGAEFLLMARKSGPFVLSEFEPRNDNNVQPNKGKHARNQNKIASDQLSFDNFLVFLTVLVFKVALFETNLILRLVLFPIWFFNLCLVFLMFPFRTLSRIRDHTKKKLRRALNASYLRLISFFFNRIKSRKSILNPLLRLSRAVFRTIHMFFVLVVMLISSFAISGVIVKILVEESIHTTEILNFDYTKTSPVAFVPISTSSLVDGIPDNHNLKLTVSLTLPESEYNTKLGIFQVKVESLSEDGKVILGSSYPTMLRFKSRPFRAIGTLFNAFPLITGLKSEVQNLKIVMRDEFKEGYDEKKTACFKVVLEQRAEFLENGSGVPEIYGATLEISSEIPPLKNLLLSWRRTVFVWIGFMWFGGEIVIFVLIIFPGRKLKDLRTNKKKS